MSDEMKKAEPVDELFVGELTPQEMQGIQQVKGQINQTLMEIGHLEVQKNMKLGLLDQLEKRGQQIVQGARTRLDIGEDATLQVTPDGKIRKLPPNVVSVNPQGS